MLAPASFTFPCFNDPVWRQIVSPPEGIEKWEWNSAEAIREICARNIARQMKCDLNAAEKLFSFDEYTDLNRSDNRAELRMTWFLAVEIGYLFRLRDSSTCPWNDPDLFIPAKWGRRVVMAVEMGLKRVVWGMHNLEGGRFDGGTRTERPLSDLLK